VYACRRGTSKLFDGASQQRTCPSSLSPTLPAARTTHRADRFVCRVLQPIFGNRHIEIELGYAVPSQNSHRQLGAKVNRISRHTRADKGRISYLMEQVSNGLVRYRSLPHYQPHARHIGSAAPFAESCILLLVTDI